jgi:carbamoyl-phosphate synthase large subunit
MKRRGGVLITGASGSIAFNISRCLREADSELFLLSGCVLPLGPGFLSPITNARYVLPRFDEDPTAHITQLLELLMCYEIDSIMAGGDADVALLSLFRDVIWKTGARFLVPAHESVEIANDKRKTYQFASAHHIPQPRYVIVDPATATMELFDVFGGAMTVVKDRTTYTTIAPNAIVALEMCKWIGGMLRESMVVQEYVPGREIATLSLVDAGGTVLHTVAICKLMTDKDGETREAITIDAPEIVALSEHVIRLLNWVGPIEVEWRISDITGRPLLQEVNGRFPAWVYITTATGANLVWAYRELLLGRHPGTLPSYRRGVVLSRTPYDITAQMEPF